MNRVHGWFSDNKTWIEFVIATVVLYLLTIGKRCLTPILQRAA
jgi:hypothetical protein